MMSYMECMLIIASILLVGAISAEQPKDVVAQMFPDPEADPAEHILSSRHLSDRVPFSHEEAFRAEDPNTECGGTTEGMEGILLGSLHNNYCNWNISVPEGYVIVLTFNNFKFPNCESTVKVGNEVFGRSEIRPRTYCSSNKGTIFISSNNNMYVHLNKTSSTYGFTATWKAITEPACCHSYVISADKEAYISTYDFYRTNFIGTFYADGTKFRDKWPVYRNEKANRSYLAHGNETQSSWVMCNDDYVPPGSGRGFMVYGPFTARCPHEFYRQIYRDQVAEEDKEETKAINFTCQTVCTLSPPVGPGRSTSDYEGKANAFDTLVTYTCPNGLKDYSRCLSDGTWSPPGNSTCDIKFPRAKAFLARTEDQGINKLSREYPCATFTSPNRPKRYRETFIRWIFKTQVDCPRARITTEFLGPFEVKGHPLDNCKDWDYIMVPWKEGRKKRLCGLKRPDKSVAKMERGTKYPYVFKAGGIRNGKGFKAKVCLVCPED